MKKFILFIALFGLTYSINAQDTEINWMTLEDAVAAQAKAPRKIMMDMFTTWCGPCKLLDKNTFHNPDLASYVNKNYYAVKFNAEGNEEVSFNNQKFTNPNFDVTRRGRNSAHELASYMGVQGYPTIIFLDEKGGILLPLTGYRTPNQLELFLKLFATDKHKEISTQEEFQDYQKQFKPEFKS
jgi:thioredoxin-related protein